MFFLELYISISNFNFYISLLFGYKFLDIFSSFTGVLYIFHDGKDPKLCKIRSLTLPSFQLVPYLPENFAAWFCYREADFHGHGVSHPRAQFLAVVKALPHEVNRYVSPEMFIGDVSEPDETLTKAIRHVIDLHRHPTSLSCNGT